MGREASLSRADMPAGLYGAEANIKGCLVLNGASGLYLVDFIISHSSRTTSHELVLALMHAADSRDKGIPATSICIAARVYLIEAKRKMEFGFATQGQGEWKPYPPYVRFRIEGNCAIGHFDQGIITWTGTVSSILK